MKHCPAYPWLFLLLASLLRTHAESLSAASTRGEPLGPSNRRGPVVISEMMFRPAPTAEGQYLQFVELYNSQLWPEDISGYRLSGTIDFLFPPGTVMAPESFLVIAKDPEGVQAVYHISNVTGPYEHALSSSGGTVELRNRSGAILWACRYSPDWPWPLSANGAGHSLVLRSPSLGEGLSGAWAQSSRIGGSPGGPEPTEPNPLDSIVLNEWRAEGRADDFVELYNHAASARDVSGAILTLDPQSPGFIAPAGTVIPPGGFVSFSAAALGFSFDPRGGAIYLIDPAKIRVLDAVRVIPQPAGLSAGRVPDGSDLFRGLAVPTPGGANSAQRPAQVIIHEIMYNPISGNAADEFIELYNTETNAISLDNWRVSSGIRFQFPTDTQIGGLDYLVIARRAERFLSNYPAVNPSKVLGDFSGTLSGSGDRIVLARPRVIPWNTGQSLTETVYIPEDEVTYGTGGRWGAWADGGGSSLELVNRAGDRDLAGNWAPSDESLKSGWITFEATGPVDLTSGTYPADTLQILLMGEGECLIDDVEVFTTGGSNRVVNPRFDKGIESWVPQGSHIQSSWEPPGPLSPSGALHVRATHRGDTGANRIRTRLSSTVTRGATVTIRAKARWLKGFPEVLLRLRGNGLEAVGQLPLPANLGSPGAANHQVALDRPAFFQATHAPAVPAANQPVIVTARVDNPPASPLIVTLRYRIDPGTNYTKLGMNDNGTDGDAVGGDGVYSATIPGYPAATLVAFSLSATNELAMSSAAFPADAPLRECLVRFGDTQTSGRFGTYRLWMTQSNINTWANRTRPKLSNEPLDGTFVYGNSRVIYNIGAYYSGSPFHSPNYNTPTGTLCNYSFRFPKDDAFLGSTEFKLTSPGNNPGDDDTAQREQTAYWMAAQLGLPYNYQRNVHLIINGARRGKIFEDTQSPSEDIIEEWFPEQTAGDLYKVAGWFEFDDAASAMETTWATLGRFLSGGKKKLARYRWNFQKRAADLSTSNYTNLFQLVDAANTGGTEAYQAAVELLVDVDQWMRVFALEHVVGNWDSWGDNNGQNMYLYKPPGERWQLLIWDLDIVLGLGGYSDGPTSSLFQVADGTIDRMYKFPAFRRAYWRAIQAIVRGAVEPTRVNPTLDARYNAFSRNGISVTSPAGIKTFIASRRTYLLNQLRTVTLPFEITSRQAADFETAEPYETLTGIAPVELKTLQINGREYPIRWTTVSNWSVRIPLHSGHNLVRVQGFDPEGHLLPAATDTLNIVSTSSSDGSNNHPLINEWMASNLTTITDPLDGRFKDWLELFNPASVQVDLSGFVLANGRLDPQRFVFPPGSILEPNSYLILWADNEDPPVHPYHLPFKLSQQGGQLLLYAPGGALVDSVAFGQQTPDLSEGRSPIVPELIGPMNLPTPGAANLIEELPVTVPVLLGRADKQGVELRWTSQVGKTYHLQYKNDLNEPAWRNLPGDVVAGESITAKTNAPGPLEVRRFYRVQQVD